MFVKKNKSEIDIFRFGSIVLEALFQSAIKLNQFLQGKASAVLTEKERLSFVFEFESSYQLCLHF